MIHRGEHSEITTVAGGTVDSELSGNMIDICPVGALTSKPFRYSARTWELSRRKSVSPHDSTGANLIVQVKGNQVMRVVPLENEDVNECWIADRDRFSYEALNSRVAPDRADDQAGRPVAGGGLEHRARLRGRRPEAHQGRVRRAGHRRAGHAAQHGRRTAPAGQAGARPGQREHRLPHCAMPTSPTPRRRARRAGSARSIASLSTLQSRPRRRLVPAQGPSAVRAAPAPGGAQGRADPQPACAARRLADADGQQPDRRAERLAAGAGRRGRGRGGAARAWPRRCRRTPDAAATAIARSLLAASARPCCSATPPRSTRRPASCWRWRNGSASRPAPASATSARPPTASARSWSVRCPGQAA